ncbi:MAG TPA: hypothetical protein VMX12_12560, partial [Acidimicrobiia bacterium]|nr:hypothetical protein [Acidimicrobiia bacterium]
MCRFRSVEPVYWMTRAVVERELQAFQSRAHVVDGNTGDLGAQCVVECPPFSCAVEACEPRWRRTEP